MERDPSSRLLTTHFVTEGFLEDVRNRISEKISTQMWSDLEVIFLVVFPLTYTSLTPMVVLRYTS